MYAPAPPNVPSMAGSEWTHIAHRPYHSNVGFGFFGRYFSNLCIALSSCFYFLCCCWALEDCIGRPRWEIGHSDPRPGPISGPFGPNPPDIPITLPGPPGQPAPAEALIGDLQQQYT